MKKMRAIVIICIVLSLKVHSEAFPGKKHAETTTSSTKELTTPLPKSERTQDVEPKTQSLLNAAGICKIGEEFIHGNCRSKS